MTARSITGVEHVAIASFSPRRLADWYIRCLDFALLHDTGDTLYLRAANGVVVEFVHADSTTPAPEIRSAGLRHIALAAVDLAAARGELEARGIEFKDGPITRPGLRLQFFQDPEGNYLHLVQRDCPLMPAEIPQHFESRDHK
jgi:catechol-2,3-dioxygenase